MGCTPWEARFQPKAAAAGAGSGLFSQQTLVCRSVSCPIGAFGTQQQMPTIRDPGLECPRSVDAGRVETDRTTAGEDRLPDV